MDAVVQVLAEAALRDQRLQVAVRRADQAQVDVDLGLTAQAPDAAVLQHPQQLDLQRRRQLGHLVQEQRAAVGLLEVTAPSAVGTGVGAALVAEELGLDQRVGDGTAVDRDEGCIAARVGQRMQVPGQHLLAAAALAGDEHGARARSDARGLLLQRPDGPRHAQFTRSAFGLRVQSRLAHDLAYLLNQFGDVEGLGHIVRGPLLEQRDRALERAMGGDEEEGRRRSTEPGHLGKDLLARQVGQPDVADHRVVGPLAQRLRGLAPARVPVQLEALELEAVGQRLAHDGVVLDQAESGHQVSCGGSRGGWAGGPVSGTGNVKAKRVHPPSLPTSMRPWSRCTIW